MKFSNSFIPTTKETPNDATLASHQYLVRAGFIHQQGSGLYNYLPMGKIVLDKIRNIVKDELDKAGCIELQLGFVTPIELWEKSGRANKMGKEMLIIKDRKLNKFVLSPTNEEAMVEVVKNRITSYKDLPKNLYQINTKFRDEARPRFGLMRSREFLMKDGYSFHSSKEEMEKEFLLMEKTYKKIFNRLGVDFRVVEADSGAIGGTGSKEFMILADSGEDTIVVCNNCEYSANIETATREEKKVEVTNLESKKIETLNLTKIEDISNFLNIKSNQIVKAVIKKAIYENSEEIVIFFIKGDDSLENIKGCNSVDSLELVDASLEDIENNGLIAGYVGFVNLPTNIKFVIDKELKGITNIVCGANEKNYHLVGQDITKLENVKYADLIVVKENDRCSCCGGELYYTKGIEVGHIFQLGDKYSKALDTSFLNSNGKKQYFEMGTYGIGVSRLIAGIIEQNHDEKGCIWTKETAPYFVDIIVSNGKKDDELSLGIKLYKELQDLNIDVILDDRKKERFGFKMGDFELIGFPYAIIIGKKLKDGFVELICRKTAEKQDIKIENIVQVLNNL
jgi:prolyl-tRNA synthetase